MAFQSTSGSDKTGKPSDHNCSIVRDLQKRKKRENHHNTVAVDGHALTGGASEDSRGPPFKGKPVKGAGGAVGIGIASRKD